VLVVLDIKKNLISTSKLTKDLSCAIEFISSGFKIKDKITGIILAARRKQGGLYAPHEGGAITALSAVKFGRAPKTLWHQRLGHPHSKLLHNFASKHTIDVFSWLKSQIICSICRMGKICHLPFPLNNKIETAPLTKNHCDLWGPAPIASV